MVQKQRGTRSDSTDAAVAAALAASQPLPEWPEHIRFKEGVQPFWTSILRARAREEWDDVQLAIAAQLARCQLDIEEQTVKLDDEGQVLEKLGKGDGLVYYANPRVSVLEQLARRQMMLMRSMGLCGVAALGDKRNLQNKRNLQKQADRAQQEVEDEEEGLLT